MDNKKKDTEFKFKCKRFLIGWIILMAALTTFGFFTGESLHDQAQALLLITIGWWTGAVGWYLIIKYWIYNK